MISVRDDYRVRLCALLSTLLIGSAGCGGKRQPNAAAPAHTTIIARVKGVAPLASSANARRHLWRVEMEAVQLVEGTPAVEPGDALTIRVHSVVRTFGHDTSAVIGRQFRLVYAQEFAHDYSGDVEVSAPVQNRATASGSVTKSARRTEPEAPAMLEARTTPRRERRPAPKAPCA